MSKIEDLVTALEHKINKVLLESNNLKKTNSELVNSLKSAQKTITSQSADLIAWNDKYQTLKMANTILGSDNDKRETKLKINTLIRDIDHCIEQLSE